MAYCVHIPEQFSVLPKTKGIPFDTDGRAYWSIVQYSSKSDNAYQWSKIDRAFKAWNDELSKYGRMLLYTDDHTAAYVKISFLDIVDYYKNSPYGITPDTLGVSYPTNSKQKGIVHINDNFDFLAGQFDLHIVIKHEIGHILDVLHSEAKDDIMYETYSGNADITEDSRRAIAKIYGKQIALAEPIKISKAHFLIIISLILFLIYYILKSE